MRVVAVIQARMGSTRLPGKVLLPLCGKPTLWHIMERVKRSSLVDEVAVTIPMKDGEALNPVIKECGVRKHYRRRPEEENDLVKAYWEAGRGFKADAVVRVCADNPCIEPGEIDRLIEHSRTHETHAIYSNTHDFNGNGYPDGIGAEIYSMTCLWWMQGTFNNAEYREYPHKQFFDDKAVGGPKCPPEFARPDLKLDVNTQEEYEFIKDIYEALWWDNREFHVKDVIGYLDGIDCKAV